MEKQSSWSFGLNEETLKYQVDNYDTLKIHQSYRGISSLLLWFSVAITFIFIMLNLLSFSAIIDMILLAALALLVYKGYRWALIAAIIIWTFEKLWQIVAMPTGALVAILWWYFYIQTFYRALQVEKERLRSKAVSMPPTIPPSPQI